MRLLLDFAIVAVAVWSQWALGRRLDQLARSLSRLGAAFARAAGTLCAAWCLSGLLVNLWAGYTHYPLSANVRILWCGAAFVWALGSTGAALWLRCWEVMTRRIPQANPGRRKLLRTAGIAVAGAPFAVTGFGTFVQRTRFRVRENAISIPGLASDLAGFRIVQLSDIHLGPFLSAPELARAVAAANELQGDLAVITGDLISVAGDPLDECLAELARLRSPHGLFGCLGNHELHAEAEDYTEREGRRRGIEFLRRRAVLLRIGGARLNLAGVDYQRTKDRPRYLHGCETLRAEGALNILLSHNPDVFPAAVRKGFDLTLAGHTHGGQVTVEILEQTVNVARFVTPFVAGRYQQGGKSLYVSRGIGTIGLPTRLGASPEITLVRLEPA